MVEGRAGSLTVLRLASEINAQIIRTLAGGFDAPARTREIQPADDDEPKYAITARGIASLPVANALEYWLLKAPGGAWRYGEERAQEAIEALARAWGFAVMHAFAYAPHTAGQLEAALGELDRRQIDSLLEVMHRAGLLETHEGERGELSYFPTEWLRRSIGPIAIAARVERSHPPKGAAPIDALDVEAALLLAMPLVRLPGELSGSCRLAWHIGRGGVTGVTVAVDEGRIADLASGVDGEASAEASGDIRAWFRALIDARPHRLDFDGDRRLARALVDGLGDAVFGGG